MGVVGDGHASLHTLKDIAVQIVNNLCPKIINNHKLKEIAHWQYKNYGKNNQI